MGLSESGEDVDVGLLDDKEQKYSMQGKFSEGALREFMQAFLDGECNPILKFQSPSEKNNGPKK